MKTRVLLILTIPIFAGCQQRLDGTYADYDRAARLTFVTGNEVIVSGLGIPTLEISYMIDGDKLVMMGPDGTMTLTLLKSGDIQTSKGLILRKQINPEG